MKKVELEDDIVGWLRWKLKRLWWSVWHWTSLEGLSDCCNEPLHWLRPDELLAMGKAKGLTTEQTIMATIFRGSLSECPSCKNIYEGPHF